MSKIRDIVKKADASLEITAEVKESLKTLMELSEAKAQIFQDEIETDLRTGKTIDDLTVPITKVVQKTIEYRGITSTSKSDIIHVISESIKGMIADSSAQGIVTGVSTIVNGIVDVLLGAGQGEEQVIKKYLVITDYPAIVRLDFCFWCRQISAESIRKHCETAMACVCYKSAVDVKQLAFNDFLAVYSQVLRASFGSDQSKIKEMIQQAKEVYDMFTDAGLIDMDQAVRSALNPNTPNTLKVYPPVKATVGSF